MRAICEASAGLIHHFADTLTTGIDSAMFKQIIADIPLWFANQDDHDLLHATLEPLMPVKWHYRSRIRCATLPFEAYALALGHRLIFTARHDHDESCKHDHLCIRLWNSNQRNEKRKK